MDYHYSDDTATLRLIERRYGYDRSDASNTQATNTPASYKKVIDMLEWLGLVTYESAILDYPSGLGCGSVVLGSMDYKSTTVEPYYNHDRGTLVGGPDYTDIDDVPSGSFDVVLNIYCLNVVPHDIREEIILKAYDKLKPGGVLIFIARDRIPGNPVHYISPTEYLMSKKSKTSISGMTYQKAFGSSKKLSEYISKVLAGHDAVVTSVKLSGASTMVIKPLV